VCRPICAVIIEQKGADNWLAGLRLLMGAMQVLTAHAEAVALCETDCLHSTQQTQGYR
jgi:hypothetical protein